MKFLIPLLLVLGLCAGCVKDGVSEADQAAVRKEFSQESYEEAMKKAGRGAELEEEKRRAAEHMQGR